MPGTDAPDPPAWADRLLRGLARRVLGIFFRRLEVVGLERVPEEAPLVVVANHVNGLVDPAILAGVLPRMPRFLGKSTLWEYRALRPLLELAGAIPVYRRHDPGVDPSKNVETFALAWAVLARGGVVALFPEGVSHSEPTLQPLKTGAARILLGAERRHGGDGDASGLGSRVLPVGLVYDAKHKFRSRVLVQIGDPLDPDPQRTRHLRAAPGEAGEDERREAVRALTERIDQALERVTLNFDSWEEARLVALAADLYARPRAELPDLGHLEESVGRRQAFAEGYRRLREAHPERTAAVACSVQDYDALLQAFHLRDRQVAAEYPPAPVAGFLLRTLFRLAVLLPLAVVGTALNWIPYRILGLVAGRYRNLPDQQATYKVFPGLLIYPAVWLLEAVGLGWAAHHYTAWSGLWSGLVVLLLTPLQGWLALRFHDVRRRVFHEVRAFLMLATRRRLTAELKARRAEVHAQISELVDLYLATEPEPSEN